MPTQRKIFTVQNLAEKFKQAKALVLTDYQGLNVEQINELRNEIKKAGGEFEVVKNALFHLAAKTSSHSASKLVLTGPTATLWAYSDDPAPLKALKSFIKKTGLPKIKLGFWDQESLSVERINELASLPAKAKLQAKLVSTLDSPISGLTHALNWNIRKFLLVLKTLKTRGGEN